MIFQRPHALTDAQFHYCPGCSHGIVHRLVAEAMDELGIEGRTVGIAPVGCAVFAYDYFNCDMVQAAHGRAQAVATGIKRARPDSIVFTYQGDGDLAAIGIAETVHAATRGENITVIFINNAIYGMTGGQMAPTTLLGQKSTTSPMGRDADAAGMGFPIRVAELIATLDGTRYIARGAVNNAANVRKVRQYIKKAFEAQLAGIGNTMVEILSPCPTNWTMDSLQAVDWLEKNMIPVFPLGEIKNNL